ncbi:hypothetical protein JM658_05010 [Joostella atrarenae]|uniref:OmpA family protein n=1 Tax=Joostella atrarenae TaxID=679257 RepID=A0ABS9J182_9FLAO|nr:hypothetical protein [Joostella atrarenae]MCF8714182.1 hypothetical protein [Joostella atrarenae]
MRTFTITLLLLVLSINTPLSAQSKKELKEQVATLNDKVKVLKQTQSDLAVSQNKVKSLEFQVEQLEETNKGLLDNMNNFLSTSTQQSNSISRTLEALRKREKQIKGIRDTFSANDSVALLVLTDLKKTLGENAQIGVEKGSIIVKMENSTLFSGKEDNPEVTASAKDFIGRLAATITKYPELSVSAQSAGDDWRINSLRASAITKTLQEDFEIAPTRLKVTTNTGGGNVSYIFLHPDFNAFYLEVRDDLKKL